MVVCVLFDEMNDYLGMDGCWDAGAAGCRVAGWVRSPGSRSQRKRKL